MEQLEFRPIYQQISDSLKQKIIDGSFSSGSMLPSEDLLAGQFKVSKPTIRKSLEILRSQRFISKQNGRGAFVTYEMENVQKVRRVGIYGIHTEIPNNFHQSLLLTGISEEAGRTKNIELVILPHNEEFSHFVNAGAFDGFIIVGPSAPEMERLMKTPLLSIPHVIVSASSDMMRERGFIFIDSDNVQGAYEAVTHLIKLGHRRIIYSGGRADRFNCMDRLKGYKKALSDNGIDVDPLLINEVIHKIGEEVNVFIESLLAGNIGFTAVFAGGLGLALESMKFLQNKNLRIPEDISVVGFDDFETAMFMSPPLTTVRQPISEMGTEAVKMLTDQFRGEKLKNKHVCLDTELIVRKSTGKVL